VSTPPPPALRRADTSELRKHQDWLGFVQPVGLVVSLPALEKAQAYVNRNILRQQQALILLSEPEDAPERLTDFAAFCRDVLAWQPTDLAGAPGGPEIPASIEVPLPEYGEILRPTYAVPNPDKPGGFLLLIQVVQASTDLDKPLSEGHHGWQASPEARFERLLRESDVPIGLLVNGASIRLVYAPRGESSGHITFPVKAMCETAGRPILGALHMLLEAERLFTMAEGRRLPAILKDSRRYQNEVSTALSEQVLNALHELLRGFQAAHETTRGRLLQEVLREAKTDVYGGLLATLLRLVFILYAEDRNLLPSDPVYVRHYAVTALFEKLREDAARYPDAMDQRFGAWARLITLFRLIHDGGGHGRMRLPSRYGRLFDPDAYPFLEGRPHRSRRVLGDRLDPPKVSDGVVFRVLSNLLLLKGDRLSYRALDVEQIGSVYEAMMGFALEEVSEPSIAVRPHHVVVGLTSLSKLAGPERLKRLADEAGCKVTGKAQEAVKLAKTPADLVTALGKSVSPRTPEILGLGTLVLQPTEERRRSGSHYTPRALTEPIVATTLRPIFEQMGADPTPEAILALKVCDPAMGSGAFLVAACRALGEKLVAAWQKHGMPALPLDEDPVLHARRIVAQRCLYGVDKNPFAVDLAKLSLWLVTLAKDHPFTFLDHALRQGDSLVGLSRQQIASFHWEASETPIPLIRGELDQALTRAGDLRLKIHALADSDDVAEKRRLHQEADAAIEYVRYVGDRVIDAYFSEKNEKERKKTLGEYAKELIKPGTPVPEHETYSAFHWEIEFPEVFSRENPGFNAFVGNPPFAGKNTMFSTSGETYVYFLIDTYEGAHGSSDLVAYFFRRAFSCLRTGGALGLIATNTIAQGDTRATGLRWICAHGGTIFSAIRRYKWPGSAAVIVSIIHIRKGALGLDRPPLLNGSPIERISAFLFHKGGDENPVALQANKGRSFIGSYVLGMGFTFDDSNDNATPISEMERLIAEDPRNQQRIFAYLGGEELNSSPTHEHRRYVINFADMSEEEARAWPELFAIVERKVKPERQRLGENGDARRRKAHWWRWGQYSHALFEAIRNLNRVLACSLVSKHLSFTWLPSSYICSHKLAVFAFGNDTSFTILQSRIHEVFARFFSSTMKDDLNYSPTDCFETFPFPPDWQQDPRLEVAGKTYDEFRAALMVKNNEGLTTTYNRFHDPDEHLPGILQLRELHAAMDRAVLDAYGFTDLKPICAFLLDYEEEEDEDEPVRARAKKKPWRYRWPDEVRDEVLARLLALNAERAAEERKLGAEAGLKTAGKRKKAEPGDKGEAAEKKEPKGKGRGKKGGEGQGSMFD
jgi:hypothetical protein